MNGAPAADRTPSTLAAMMPGVDAEISLRSTLSSLPAPSSITLPGVPLARTPRSSARMLATAATTRKTTIADPPAVSHSRSGLRPMLRAA